MTETKILKRIALNRNSLARMLFNGIGRNPPHNCEALPWEEQPPAIRQAFVDLLEAGKIPTIVD